MKLELTQDEALVLSDWLYSNQKNDTYLADEAVKRVLWNIECQLERKLVEPFYENYSEIIAKAKAAVNNDY